MSSNKPEYHKINVLLIPNVAWTNGLGPVPACATCFRQCPLYTFRERLFPTDLRLLDWGVAVGGGWEGEPRPDCILPQRLPLEGPGSFKGRVGVRAACMGVAVISSGCLE